MVLPLAGCFKTPRVEQGTGVRFEYTVLDDQGADVGGGIRLGENVQGSGQLLPALENAFSGRKEGEEFSVTIAPGEGYGEYQPAKVKEFPLASIPKNPLPEPGRKLQAALPDGTTITALIQEVRKDTVVLDFNHPFAGKTLVYHITISHFFKPAAKGEKK